MEKQHDERFEVLGERRTEVLKRCGDQLDEWGLTMPDDDPLLFHFGLDDFLRIGVTEFWICNLLDEGYCGKYLFLFDKQRCPNHYHKMKHETFNVVKGTVMMTMDGVDHELPEGSVFLMPTETKHTFAAVDGPALILEVSKPCLYVDSYFSDPDIAIT